MCYCIGTDCMYAYIHVYVSVCVCVCACACARACVCVCDSMVGFTDFYIKMLTYWVVMLSWQTSDGVMWSFDDVIFSKLMMSSPLLRVVTWSLIEIVVGQAEDVRCVIEGVAELLLLKQSVPPTLQSNWSTSII